MIIDISRYTISPSISAVLSSSTEWRNHPQNKHFVDFGRYLTKYLTLFLLLKNITTYLHTLVTILSKSYRYQALINLITHAKQGRANQQRWGKVTDVFATGKVYERKKPRKVASPTWEIRSSYPLRENIWEYLQEDKKNFCHKRKNSKACYKQIPQKNKAQGKTAILLAFMFIAVAMIGHYF